MKAVAKAMGRVMAGAADPSASCMWKKKPSCTSTALRAGQQAWQGVPRSEHKPDGIQQPVLDVRYQASAGALAATATRLPIKWQSDSPFMHT